MTLVLLPGILLYCVYIRKDDKMNIRPLDQIVLVIHKWHGSMPLFELQFYSSKFRQWSALYQSPSIEGILGWMKKYDYQTTQYQRIMMHNI